MALVNGVEHGAGYKTLARSGDMIGSNKFGLIVDKDGNAVGSDDGAHDVAATKVARA